ncbi:AAA family ATPase [Veronia pacifica]|uniref:Shikimate kinase n=1 Tax=Veronia pacifica TaxID=1080227 RepID=A0A1C3EK86_9GAMM|nr:AAA family ATPase [Veronia pacifica]ODA33633.1 hypothetical protein A8L45_09640 [Veronia pacifica]
MDVVVIFGPPAVGKMTVGMALAESTGYRLMHNHMTLELVHNFFEFDDPEFWPLVREIREKLFSAIKDSNLPGLIYTFVWALDRDRDRESIENYCSAIGVSINDVKFVELTADQDTRLLRNKTELRLAEKKSKNDLEKSEANLLDFDQKHQMNTENDFIFSNHLKIDNTNLSPQQTAQRIVRHFGISK